MSDCCDDCNKIPAKRAGITLKVHLQTCVDGETTARELFETDTFKIFLKPVSSNPKVTILPAVLGDADGLITAVTEAQSLPTKGTWTIWGEVTRVSGSNQYSYPSLPVTFEVFEN